ncbi:hypothetical protein HMI56_005668 [Coelomomyces lativittatus]|nr:hypothetical protein HMI56_005668 [Coelomomyces lativittatus]
MPKKSSLTSFVNLNPTLIMDPSQFQLSIHPQSPFLILLSTDTVNTLNHFLIRASIYVENPIHQFKSYSIDEFNQLKVTEYHGHNLSLKLLSQFFASTKLSSAEIQLKNWFVRKKWLHPVTSRCLTSTAESMYLLGWVRTHVSVARHELHHAIYFFHPEYRRGVSSIWNTLTPMAKRQMSFKHI